MLEDLFFQRASLIDRVEIFVLAVRVSPPFASIIGALTHRSGGRQVLIQAPPPRHSGSQCAADSGPIAPRLGYLRRSGRCRRQTKKEQSVSKGIGGAPGEIRTPDPLLRSRLSTFIKTCRSERKAEENQQVVTTSDQLLAPSSSPLSRLLLPFVTISITFL